MTHLLRGKGSRTPGRVTHPAARGCISSRVEGSAVGPDLESPIAITWGSAGGVWQSQNTGFPQAFTIADHPLSQGAIFAKLRAY